MANAKKPAGIPDSVKRTEGDNLKRIWDRFPPMSQADFATVVLGKSAGYLPQFFKGIRPIQLDDARLFAKHLKCSISEFSERLAHEDALVRALVRWPFSTVGFSEIAALEPWDRAELEGVMRSFLLRIASQEPAPRGRRVARTKSA